MNHCLGVLLQSTYSSPVGVSPSLGQMSASASNFVSCFAISRLDLSVVYVSSPAVVSKSTRSSFRPCMARQNKNTALEALARGYSSKLLIVYKSAEACQNTPFWGNPGLKPPVFETAMNCPE